MDNGVVSHMHNYFIMCFIQRSALTRRMLGPLPNLSVLQVVEAYNELDPLDRPLVATMGMSATKPLVKSKFGLMQRGSILSYQHPKLHSKNIVTHHIAQPYPSLPLEGNNLLPTECRWVCTEEE